MGKINDRLLFKRRLIKRDFEYRKYSFDIENYYEEDENTELRCICPNGHLFMISWVQWQRGHKCPRCYLNGRVNEKDTITGLMNIFVNNKRENDYEIENVPKIELTIDFIREQFAIEYYRLLTEKFVTDKPNYMERMDVKFLIGGELTSKIKSDKLHQELEFICPRGHRNIISWKDWERGIRCSSCCLSELPIYNKLGFMDFSLQDYINGLNKKRLRLEELGEILFDKI